MTAVLVGLSVSTAMAIAVRLLLSSPPVVVSVSEGASLLGCSKDRLYWLDERCGVWRTSVGAGAGSEPGQWVLLQGECPPDDPRFDGGILYHLAGHGTLDRYDQKGRTVLLERALSYAIALDDRFVYLGSCGRRRDCRIERVPVKGGEPTLMQAGILALANMDVDDTQLFWVDRGRERWSATTRDRVAIRSRPG
jgi:hypothetical protein